MKRSIFLATVFLGAVVTSAVAEELNDALVAQQIIKDEGYQLFHFVAPDDRRYQLEVVDSEYSSGEQPPPGGYSKGNRFIIPLEVAKDFTIAVQLDPNNSLKWVRVYSLGQTRQQGNDFTLEKIPACKILSREPTVTVSVPFLKLQDRSRSIQIVLQPYTEPLLLNTEEGE